MNDRDHAVAALERAILRGPRPSRGTAGLARALNALRDTQADLHPSDPRRGLTEADIDAAEKLVATLGDALAPLESLASAPRSFAAFAQRHREVLSTLSRHAGDETAFAGPDGVKLGEALDELAASEAAAGPPVEPRDYVELFAAALAGRVVRRPPRPGLRVRILGLLEARLTVSDRVVLGGLVEGTWPPETRSDAWLSRPMRLALGLDLPERRIGLTAHDFAQLLGAREVILTRAAKLEGAPTNPSRFIQRLAAVAGDRWQAAVDRGNRYLRWARDLDRPETVRPAKQPAPKPPRAVRPKGLSVTEIEHWLRDPYTIYAKHILRLQPLDPVDADPGAAERGTFIHAAIGDFTRLFAKELPADPAGELIKLGRKHFAALQDFPEARAFWWPRFTRIAHWFARWDLEQRAAVGTIEAEIKGEIEIPLVSGTFRLRGVADRIERDVKGRCTIFDYKTGAARTEKQVRIGLAPQLTLESAILRAGGFAGIPPGTSVVDIVYVLLKGGEPAGIPERIAFKDGTPDSQADRALEKLTALARRFEDENEPYRSLVHPMWATHYGPYDHLARVREWSSTGGVIDDVWGGS
jgi:ATP-dependent helicase/nuclease subunit B